MKTTKPGRHVSSLTNATYAVILAGGRGSRLKHLTLNRAKPATPFGGKYRIIDFPLSNCVNSGIRRIGVMTQYKAHSLIRHLQQAWGHFRGEFGEYVELLPAQQQIDSSWYKGTADAVYQNLEYIRDHRPDHVLVLAGDHVYKMDYGLMLAQHVATGADITVGTVVVPVQRGREFGIMSMEEDNRIVEFVEKPEEPKELPGRPGFALASMGIYVFSFDFLDDILRRDAGREDSSHDFGKDIIPGCIEKNRVMAYVFQDAETKVQHYWRDVGNVDAFYEANLELTHVHPELNLYDAEWPIWTYQEHVPPAKFVLDEDGRRGHAVGSMVSGGCIISGSIIRSSLLFTNVIVGQHSYMEGSVVMPDVHIGANCLLRRCVIEQGCRIPDGTRIGADIDEDRRRFFVTRNSVVLVTPEMLDQGALLQRHPVPDGIAMP